MKNFLCWPFCFGLALFVLLWVPTFSAAGTIEPGERRVVQGELSVVDQAYRSVLVEVPTASGQLTVGVTMAKDAEVLQDGEPASLADISIGETVILEYKREGDRLIGVRLRER